MYAYGRLLLASYLRSGLCAISDNGEGIRHTATESWLLVSGAFLRRLAIAVCNQQRAAMAMPATLVLVILLACISSTAALGRHLAVTQRLQKSEIVRR